MTPVQAPADDKIRALFEPGSYEVVPHDNVRKIIAQRLVLAKQTIPHFYLTISCTLDKLLSAREDINVTAPKGPDGKPAWKLSVNDFVIKALALALIKVPQANVTWTETGMLKHKHADIGVAWTRVWASPRRRARSKPACGRTQRVASGSTSSPSRSRGIPSRYSSSSKSAARNASSSGSGSVTCTPARPAA